MKKNKNRLLQFIIEYGKEIEHEVSINGLGKVFKLYPPKDLTLISDKAENRMFIIINNKEYEFENVSEITYDLTVATFNKN